MFYNNTPCCVLAELDNDVVIELMTSIQPYYDEYETYEEPVYRKIIVPKSKITDKKITKDSIVLEREGMIVSAEREIKEKQKESNLKLRNEKLELQKQIKELRDKITKFDGLETYFQYLNGEIEYIVYSCDYGRMGIKKLSEVICGCSKSELASVSYRKIKYFDKTEYIDKVQMFVGSYSDDSGTKYRVTGFKTRGEAKEQLKSQITEENINKAVLSECKNWGIESDITIAFEKKQEKESNDRKEKERKQLEAKLKSLDD